MKLLFATVLTLLAGTAMSASILHKEIEIAHDGVHYKVVVDAEKLHDVTHNPGVEDDTSEIEHQDELGKIGIHYEVPHIHHHDEEEEHHGAVIHIDLESGHDQEEHSHEHHEHHDLSHHDNERQHLGLKHLEEHFSLVHPDQVHHRLDDDLNLHHLEHHHDDLEHILSHQDSGENELEHIKTYGPKHYVIGHLGSYSHPGLQHYGHHPQVLGKHHVPVHQKGNLWHLLSSKIEKPVEIQGVIPHYKHVGLESGRGSQQDIVNKVPLVELEGLYHHTDIHH